MELTRTQILALKKADCEKRIEASKRRLEEIKRLREEQNRA